MTLAMAAMADATHITTVNASSRGQCGRHDDRQCGFGGHPDDVAPMAAAPQKSNDGAEQRACQMMTCRCICRTIRWRAIVANSSRWSLVLGV